MLHAWTTVAPSLTTAIAYTDEIPAALQSYVTPGPSRYVIRARCSSGGGVFNPVGNISSVFNLAKRDLTTSFITPALGLKSSTPTFVYGADIPVSFSIARVQSSALQTVTVRGEGG